MDLKKLNKLLEERAETQEILDLFKLKDSDEAAVLWGKNLEKLKFKWNDEIGYGSLELLYDKTTEEDGNTFYQELMKESLFLRTFCDFDVNIITAFVRMIGVLRFVYITRTFLTKLPEYVFFLEMFNEYKEDLRFITEWKASTELLDQISESSNIDIEGIKEATNILAQLKEEMLPEK
jgi:hypothetical protein